MLAPKKLKPKKMIIYGIIIAIMFGGIGYLIFKNFMPKKSGVPVMLPAEMDMAMEAEMEVPGLAEPMPEEPTAMMPAETTPTQKAVDVKDFAEDELDFLKTAKFKKLRDNFSEIEVEAIGNKNPFLVKKEEGGGAE